MSFENDIERQPLYVRLALLIVGWATAGVLLYVLSTFLPAAVLATIGIAAWVVVKLDRGSRSNESLASALCTTTCFLTCVCAVALRFTGYRWHDDVLVRLIFVGVCLGAGLILLDRRADD